MSTWLSCENECHTIIGVQNIYGLGPSGFQIFPMNTRSLTVADAKRMRAQVHYHVTGECWKIFFSVKQFLPANRFESILLTNKFNLVVISYNWCRDPIWLFDVRTLWNTVSVTLTLMISWAVILGFLNWVIIWGWSRWENSENFVLWPVGIFVTFDDGGRCVQAQSPQVFSALSRSSSYSS